MSDPAAHPGSMLFGFFLRPIDNSPIHEIFKSCLIIGIEKGTTEYCQVQITMNIQRVFQDNLVLSQCPRLIRTKDINSS